MRPVRPPLGSSWGGQGRGRGRRRARLAWGGSRRGRGGRRRRPAAHRSKRDGWAAAGSAASRVPAGWLAAVPPALGAPGPAISRLLPVWRATAGLAACPPGWESAIAGQRPASGMPMRPCRRRSRPRPLSARERPRARRTCRVVAAAAHGGCVRPRFRGARSECALARTRRASCSPHVRTPTSCSRGASG